MEHLALLAAVALVPFSGAQLPRAPEQSGPYQALAAPMQARAAPLRGRRPVPRSLVALGDSVPAGTACSCTPYPQLVGTQLGRGAGGGVSVDNAAEVGATTDDVIDQLDDPDLARTVAGADVVVLTVGANDLPDDELAGPGLDPAGVLDRYRDVLSGQRARLSALLARIASLRHGNAGPVLVTGYWNVFLDGAQARALGPDYVASSTQVTLAENDVIDAVARAAGARYVDLYTPFKGSGSADDTDLLADDGDHPDADGHALIARTLLQALDRPIA